MITVDGLTIEFSGTTLFKDISFQINEKDRIALMGKNGAGKSTLLKIIAGVRNISAAFTNFWNRRRWKIFRNWRRSNNPDSVVFLSKNISSIKQKVLMFHLFEISGLYFFLSIRKTIPEKFYSEKFPSGNYQSSRRWFLGMNSLSPCFTPNASYHASI